MRKATEKIEIGACARIVPTGEESTENVFEILIDLFASLEPEQCEDSRASNGSDVNISVYQLVQNIVKFPVFRKLMCTLRTEIVSDH